MLLPTLTPTNKLSAALGAVLLLTLACLGCYAWGHHRGDTGARNELQAQYSANLADAYREAAIKQQAEAMRHLHSLLSELGLTPAAIGKVGAKEADKPKSKFERFG